MLTRAIERRGSTIRDYVGGSGLRGGFQNEFAVYGRTGEPCPACETRDRVRAARRPGEPLLPDVSDGFTAENAEHADENGEVA